MGPWLCGHYCLFLQCLWVLTYLAALRTHSQNKVMLRQAQEKAFSFQPWPSPCCPCHRPSLVGHFEPSKSNDCLIMDSWICGMLGLNSTSGIINFLTNRQRRKLKHRGEKWFAQAPMFDESQNQVFWVSGQLSFLGSWKNRIGYKQWELCRLLLMHPQATQPPTQHTLNWT